MPRIAVVVLALAITLSACGGQVPSHGTDTPRPASDGIEPPPMPGRVTCGDSSVPSFPLAVLDQPGGVDPGEDQPAAVLQALIREGGLPQDGWIRAVHTDDLVLFVARGGGVPWSMAKFQLRDGIWSADASGQCHLQPELPPGVNLAAFSVAPGAELEPDTTEVELRVTEIVCNSGEDAMGRVRVIDVVPAADSVTVLLGVVPRGGAQECPSNPETPFTLELPEPLGDRVLLDASEVPPRDARECPARLCQ
jgi:hypothetical protein